MYFRDLKVVILGAASVGKTTFIHRYIEGTFQEKISVSKMYSELKLHNIESVVVMAGGSCFYCLSTLSDHKNNDINWTSVNQAINL